MTDAPLDVRRRRVVVAALLLTSFLSALEATVVGTVMPTVVAELGGLTLYSWVTTAYLLASTVTVPVFGKLADLVGRRPVLVAGIVTFLLGSVLSGFAPSIELLIAARALQGLGAGSIQPVSMTVIGDLFTLRERGRIQALFGAVWGLAGAFGPLVGGVLAESLSWRWVFWINAPFGLLAIGLFLAAYRESMAPRRVRLDLLGAGLLTLGSLALLLAAQRTHSLVSAAVAVAALVAFGLVEARVVEPVVPLPLLRRRAILVGCLSAACLGAMMMASATFLPLLAQGAFAATPTEAGSTIAPMVIAWPIASAVTSRSIVSWGFRGPVRLGAVLLVLAVALLAFAADGGFGPSLWPLRVGMFVVGLGMGFSATALLLAMQTSVETGQRGVVTGLNIFARSMGGALGVGALGAVFALSLSGTVSEETLASLLRAHDGEAVLDPDLVMHLVDGLRPVFRGVLAFALVNTVVVAFYPRHTAAEGS